MSEQAAGPDLGYQLRDPPSDGVTSLKFLASSDQLASSSWDGVVRVHDTAQNRLVQQYHHGAPILDLALHGSHAVFTAGLDGRVKQFDIASGAQSSIGFHDKPVRCVEWLADRQLIASGSWDGSLRVWDPRAPIGQNCVAQIPLPGKVFSMSASGGMLAVATSQRQILAFNVQGIEGGRPQVQRESPLKFQTRCLRCFPGAEGYAISSVEGRVAIEYFSDSLEAQADKFAFKCHRTKEGGKDTAHPVNAIAFHPTLGTFATGGCDGVVNVWDKQNKKRLIQVPGYATSVAALAFNGDGTKLAVAASYTFEHREVDHPADQIHVRHMKESEVRPKPRT